MIETLEVVALRERVAALEADLHACRQTIAMLRQSNDFFQTIFNHAPVGIVLGALDDSVLHANPAFERMVGYSGEEVARLSVAAITPPEDAARELPLIMDLLEGRRNHYQLEKRYIHRDGHLVTVNLTGLVVRDEAGAPQWCVALAEDITERRAAEEARNWLVAILETMPDLVAYIDQSGQAQYFNQAWRQMFDLRDDVDPAAQDFTAWQPPWILELITEVALPAASRDGLWHGETVLVEAGGQAVPTRQTVLALRDSAGAVARFAMIFHDLREERRAATERLALERKLLEAQRLESLGVLAGGIAHDFNNLLTTILGHAELALLDQSLEGETREGMGKIVDGAVRASDLTRQILAYAGQGRFVIAAVDMRHLVLGMEDLLRSSASHCALRLELPLELPEVTGDEAQLRQLLLNLVVNGADAVDPTRNDGAISVSGAVEELQRADLDRLLGGVALAPGPYLRLSVADNGQGMDRPTIERIFDPFFSTKFVGRGLGLAAVSGIVRGHRGARWVESTPGVGTRFSFWLPVNGSDLAPPTQMLRPTARRGKVLVVDQAEAERERLAQLLGEVGLEAVLAADGRAALSSLSAGLPGLVAALVGPGLPPVGGQSVARAVAALRPDAPVVVLHPADEAGSGLPLVPRPTTLDALKLVLARIRALSESPGV